LLASRKSAKIKVEFLYIFVHYKSSIIVDILVEFALYHRCLSIAIKE
jgi:hypothetical protein